MLYVCFIVFVAAFLRAITSDAQAKWPECVWRFEQILQLDKRWVFGKLPKRPSLNRILEMPTTSRERKRLKHDGTTPFPPVSSVSGRVDLFKAFQSRSAVLLNKGVVPMTQHLLATICSASPKWGSGLFSKY